MEHTSEPNIVKILLDFSEYERLKHIENQYIQLHQQETERKALHTSNKNKAQSGGGFGAEFESTSSDNTVPEAASRETQEQSNSSHLQFGVQINKSDENTSFDEKKLLTLVPSNHLRNAKLLLQQFNLRGNELTWNSSGVIYIDKVAVPLSNIFLLFPLLFKKKTIKVPGFEDFVQKIYLMGLSDLIQAKPIIKETPISQPFESTDSIVQGGLGTDKTNVPWWYIGD